MTATPSEWKLLRARYATMVQQFADAWEAGRADQMAAVFTPTGVFIPDPFEGPITGRQTIEGYWKTIPQEQAEIKFRFGEIYAAGPWFSTEFKCTFRRRRTGQRMDVRGAMFCETEGEAISEMRLYFLRAPADGER